MNLLIDKYVIKGIMIIGIFAGIWSIYYIWHVKPIHSFEKQVSDLKEQIKNKDTTIGNLSTQIQSLVEENKVTGFEEYYKGYKDENVSNIDTSDNLIF